MGGPEIESFFDVERMDVVQREDERESPGRQQQASAVRMTPLVISLGGSLLYRAGASGPELDDELLKRYADWLGAVSARFLTFVVVGGGEPAKRTIPVLRRLGASESALDAFGIAMTRVNAMALRCAMRIPGTSVPTTVDEALAEGARDRTVVMGGTHPGQTTDAVAAMMAEALGSVTLIIATNVEGFFSADPNEDPNAVLYEELTAKDLLMLTATIGSGAGSKSPIDPIASRIVARSRIPTIILDGRNLDNMDDAISGRDCRGTRIVPDEGSKVDATGTEQRREDALRSLEQKARRDEGERMPRTDGERKPSGRRLLHSSRSQKRRPSEEPLVPGREERGKEKQPAGKDLRGEGEGVPEEGRGGREGGKGRKASGAGAKGKRARAGAEEEIDWDLEGEPADGNDAGGKKGEKTDASEGDADDGTPSGGKRRGKPKSDEWKLPSLEELGPD
ncbi:MAG: UMP kinase [Thermoplasmata archaeon]|nr:UMP kinase [Thermoplasmata archaeon]